MPSATRPHHGACSEPPPEVQPGSPLMPSVSHTPPSKTLLHLLAFSVGSLQVRMTSDSPIEVTSDDITARSNGQLSVFFSLGLLTCFTHVSLDPSLLIPASQRLLPHPLLLFPLLRLPPRSWCSPGGSWTLLSSRQCSFSGVAHARPCPDAPSSSSQGGLAWALDVCHSSLCDLANSVFKRCPGSEDSGR